MAFGEWRTPCFVSQRPVKAKQAKVRIGGKTWFSSRCRVCDNPDTHLPAQGSGGRHLPLLSVAHLLRTQLRELGRQDDDSMRLRLRGEGFLGPSHDRLRPKWVTRKWATWGRNQPYHLHCTYQPADRHTSPSCGTTPERCPCYARQGRVAQEGPATGGGPQLGHI